LPTTAGRRGPDDGRKSFFWIEAIDTLARKLYASDSRYNTSFAFIDNYAIAGQLAELSFDGAHYLGK
jgi:hypothetical protein